MNTLYSFPPVQRRNHGGGTGEEESLRRNGGMPRQRGHASPEGLRSEKDAVSMVKHNENEQAATKTMKK